MLALCKRKPTCLCLEWIPTRWYFLIMVNEHLLSHWQCLHGAMSNTLRKGGGCSWRWLFLFVSSESE